MPFEPEEVRSGEPVSAAWANSLQRAIRRGGELTVAPPLKLQRGATGVHLSIGGLPQWDLCELNEGLEAGSSAAAKRLTFDGIEWVDAASQEVVVYDSIGDKSGEIGDRLWAFFSAKSGRWEIVQIAC